MLRAALIAVIGLGTLAAAYVTWAPDVPPRTAAPTAQSAPPRAAESAPTPVLADLRPAVAPEAAPSGEIVERDVRDVTPSGMTAGPAVTGALVRIAPPPKPPEPEPVLPARMERLFRPMIPAAGIVVSRDRQIRLAGIEAPEADAMCGEGTRAWPCGRMARAALRRFVRARAVECEVPAGAADIPDPARCQVAGADLSEWLVAQGWATRAGDEYAEVETAARDGKRGLWGDGRPGAQPELAAASGGANAPERALSINSRVSGMP